MNSSNNIIKLELNDIQEAINFYKNAFSFEIIPESCFADVLRFGEMNIVFFSSKSAKRFSNKKSYKAKFIMDVEDRDLDEFYQKAIDNGAISISSTFYNQRRTQGYCTLQDPYGYRWVFLKTTPVKSEA